MLRWRNARASPSAVPPPGAPLKKDAPSRRRRRPPDDLPSPSPTPQSSSSSSPTSLLLALQRSDRFSRDAELLGALEERSGASDPGLLALGARLWLEGLRERGGGGGAQRRGVAESLARLAGFGGAGLFGSVCRGGEVPRRTVGAALEVLEALAALQEETGGHGSNDDEDEDDDQEPAPPFFAALRRRGRPFTRALHEACAREVRDLTEVADNQDDDDIDASE
jgi:hypothetical protein